MKLFYVEFKIKNEYIITAIRGNSFSHIKDILKSEYKNVWILRAEILN